jgi:hypothetical protein
MSEYLKKRRISSRTLTTRLFTDDEREVQRKAMNEGKDRSEIARRLISNALRTERLAVARKDETMQPVIDTYRKFMDEATSIIKGDIRHLAHAVEQMTQTVKIAAANITTTQENLETIACSARYNTEQSIVIRSLMQLYIFDVYEQLAMQCGLDAPMLEGEFKKRLNEFQHGASNELARIMENSADADNQNLADQLVDKLYRNLMKPLTDEQRAAGIRKTRW